MSKRQTTYLIISGIFGFTAEVTGFMFWLSMNYKKTSTPLR